MRFEKYIRYFFNLLFVAVIVFGLFKEPIIIIAISVAFIPLSLLCGVLSVIFNFEKLSNQYPEIITSEIIRITMYLLYISLFVIIIYS